MFEALKFAVIYHTATENQYILHAVRRDLEEEREAKF